jgi:hypothetical protein
MPELSKDDALAAAALAAAALNDDDALAAAALNDDAADGEGPNTQTTNPSSSTCVGNNRHQGKVWRWGCWVKGCDCNSDARVAALTIAFKGTSLRGGQVDLASSYKSCPVHACTLIFCVKSRIVVRASESNGMCSNCSNSETNATVRVEREVVVGNVRVVKSMLH